MEHHLLAISPIDGRYTDKVGYLSQYFSEAALMRYRTLIEVEWLIYLFNEVELEGTKRLDSMELRLLRGIYEQFDTLNAMRVKEFEKTTNHDVKAIEYFIKEQLKDGPLEQYLEFIHFGCTSEDINNLAYSCMIRDFLERELYVVLSGLVQEIHAMAVTNKSVAMMSRTHGQPASPTTLGKELINFVSRLERELGFLMNGKFIEGKINGAVGNFNAHDFVYPGVDWVNVSKEFVESLGFEVNMYSTQIEQHDGYAEVFDAVKRINTIILDFDKDMWGYISLGYFGQRVVEGEVGSSTMPHKVNPIDFENSEGNLGIANALLEHFSSKLPISRMQRDLTDSTVLRNVGMAFAYCILSYKATIRGLAKCIPNKKLIQDDLSEKWELLAEPIQMIMRKNLIPGAYEKLKELTRGKDGLSKASVSKFIKSLKLPKDDEKRALALTPDSYVGLAEKLVDSYELKIGSNGGCGPSGCGSCQGCG